jgi:hypothetical protein
MKVRELIEMLHRFDQEYDVVVEDNPLSHAPLRLADVVEISHGFAMAGEGSICGNVFVSLQTANFCDALKEKPNE